MCGENRVAGVKVQREKPISRLGSLNTSSPKPTETVKELQSQF